jgi:hypothetical protein
MDSGRSLPSHAPKRAGPGIGQKPAWLSTISTVHGMCGSLHAKPVPGNWGNPQTWVNCEKVQGSHRCPLRASGIGWPPMSNTAAQQRKHSRLPQTSPATYPTGRPFGQRVAGNAKAIVAAALLLSLALVGFAAARSLAASGAVRFTPFCSETCPATQTSNGPHDFVAGSGTGRRQPSAARHELRAAKGARTMEHGIANTVLRPGGEG